MVRFKSILLAICLGLMASIARAETISVSVAISLKEAATRIAREYETKTGDKVDLTFGSSGQLTAQIKTGARIDVFISAAQKQVDELAADALILEDSRRIVAGNSLVLIAPASPRHPVTDWKSLADSSITHIAIGEPKTVPAGQYAMQVLDSKHLTTTIKDRLVYGGNVRQVLAYVETGEADAGLVYLTDAIESGSKVKVIAVAEPTTHDPIIYPAVIIKRSQHPTNAKSFLDFFATERAKAILAEKGFSSGAK